jgi:PAB-dependent poly(A)-specific ribonuclease subunit 2
MCRMRNARTTDGYLFNDFSIAPVSAQEAVWFSLDWKVPCILYYSTREIVESQSGISPPITKVSSERHLAALTRVVPQEVFTEDACIARSWGTGGITFTPLTDNEFPKKADLVAMDAEFVTLNQEEAEAAQRRQDVDDQAVADVGGAHNVHPGVGPYGRGALHRRLHLHPGAGRRLPDQVLGDQAWRLGRQLQLQAPDHAQVDVHQVALSAGQWGHLRGARLEERLQVGGFAGRGEARRTEGVAFRVINLVVPPEQVADTVHLFHLPHHRMVSLRFLAWHFLGRWACGGCAH